MSGWTRHGLPAGISIVLGVVVGALVNVVTEGWDWPIVVGLVVLVAGWMGLEMRRAAVEAATRSAVTGLGTAVVPAVGRGSGAPWQVPAAVRHFAGRETELAMLSVLLADSRQGPGTPPVVISAIGGTAGVGKSALAIHWAHQAAGEFPDGQLYVNLRGFDLGGAVMDPAEAVRLFLDALGVPAQRIPADPEAQGALYRSELAGRRMLILLDNARDTAQVRPLLPGTSTCLVVVTSRNPLSGLVAANGAWPITLDLLTPDEAHQLLTQRLGPDRSAAEPHAVAEIIAACARLPLALAIVAARAAIHPSRPLAAIADELRDASGRLDALTTDDPYTDVRSVFSWSYHALTVDAARLFRLLGLHPGPDLSAPAAASLAALPLPHAHHLLTELTTANLLIEPTPGRYTFHDLLRAYAADLAHRTEDSQERDATIRRILDHYLHTAHTAARLLYPQRDPLALSPPQPGVTPEHPTDHHQALAWFTTERPVLLAAVDLAAATELDTHTWQLAWTLRTFLDWRGHWDDWATVQSAAVSAAERLADPLVQALAHHHLALAYDRLRRFDDAHTQLGHALDLHRQAGNVAGQAHTHLSLAGAFERQQRPREGLDHARQALDLHRVAGHRVGEANALNTVGWHHALLGDHEQALTYCGQALILFENLNDRDGQARTWDSLGYAQHHLGHHTDAIGAYQRALTLFQDLGDRYHQATILTHLGDAQQATGNLHTARDTWQQALTILNDLHHPDAGPLRTKLTTPPTT